MLMRLWMFGTRFIYAQKGLREMLLMNCFHRSMFLTLYLLIYKICRGLRWNISYVYSFRSCLCFLCFEEWLTVSLSNVHHWDTNGCCHEDGPPCVFCFITLLVLVTERGELWVNDEIWWMKIDPLSSPVTQYWWIDRSVRRAFPSVALFMPLLCYMSL